MRNRLTAVAEKVLDAAMFGVGLVEGAARGLVKRVTNRRDHASAPPPAARVPRPRRPQPSAVAEGEDIGIETPVGTTGAAPDHNPSTAERNPE